MSSYETVAGTEPDTDEQHEPRTVIRTDADGTTYMMTEIGDGSFVQWGDCHACRKRVGQCGCPSGPTAPSHIERWRINRFKDSFKERDVEPPLPVLLKQQDRRIAAVIRLLLSRGYTILPPGALDGVQKAAQEAQNTAHGDSNDAEIDTLRDALEMALAALSLQLPEGFDPTDDDALREQVEKLGEESLRRRHPTLAADLEAEGGLETSDTRQNVDDGLDKAKAAVEAARREDDYDVGF